MEFFVLKLSNSSFLLLTLYVIIFSGCTKSYNDINKEPSISGEIKDNPMWYSTGTANDVLETRVDIPVPNDYYCRPYDDLNASPRPCTLADIEGDKDPYDDYEPELHIHFETDEYMRNGTNASFEQKGKSTRAAKQSSFRIKLDTKTDLYNGERTFQLNKHFYDDTRVKNMFSFELFQSIPNFTSLRTRFVHLLIDGNNYGLFTHVEKCDKLYLKNHGFSDEDNLYKAQDYAFIMVDKLKLNDKGKPIDPDGFDSILEIKNGKDTQKVIDMTTSIENAQTDDEFEVLFNKYFNRENYITWFAINIILANKDTVTQNFFLLNPKYSDKFYFLPWDYDGIGYEDAVVPKWTKGVANWWMSPLHQKFLKIKKNRDDLNAMVRYLRDNYITDDKVHELLDKYKPLVEPYVTSLPDSRYLYGRWQAAYQFLRDGFISKNLQDYESQKGHPMPFWQFSEYLDGVFALGWEKSVDLEKDAIIYTLDVSDNVDFNTTIIHEENLDENNSKITVDKYTGSLAYKITDSTLLEKGKTYYMRVVSYEKNNLTHYQIAFDNEIENHPGILRFKYE